MGHPGSYKVATCRAQRCRLSGIDIPLARHYTPGDKEAPYRYVIIPVCAFAAGTNWRPSMCVFIVDMVRLTRCELEFQEILDMIRRGHFSCQLSQLFKQKKLKFWDWTWVTLI